MSASLRKEWRGRRQLGGTQIREQGHRTDGGLLSGEERTLVVKMLQAGHAGELVVVANTRRASSTNAVAIRCSRVRRDAPRRLRGPERPGRPTRCAPARCRTGPTAHWFDSSRLTGEQAEPRQRTGGTPAPLPNQDRRCAASRPALRGTSGRPHNVSSIPDRDGER
jgi:hypothetical protein